MVTTAADWREGSERNPVIVLVTANDNLKSALQKSFLDRTLDLSAVPTQELVLESLQGRKPSIILVDGTQHDWRPLRIHQSLRDIPIALILAPHNDREREICGSLLEEGLDACWCNQSSRQVVAHVRAVLRRQRPAPHVSAALQIGAIRMDLARHEVHAGDRLVELTPRQFQLLRQFMMSPGQVLSRQQLLDRVWGIGYALEEHALDVHIHMLRHKIEVDPSTPAYLLTVRGVGYKLSAS